MRWLDKRCHSPMREKRQPTSTELLATGMLSRMSGYTWEGISSEARFYRDVRRQDVRDLPVMSDDAQALPLAMAAQKDGFEVAPEAPLWLFLPAVWPVEARAWIRDNRIRHLRTMVEGRWVELPWGTADYLETEADEQAILQALGLPPRPRGRVWLLRPPPGRADLNETLQLVTASAQSAEVETELTHEFLDHTARTLGALFEPA